MEISKTIKNWRYYIFYIGIVLISTGFLFLFLIIQRHDVIKDIMLYKIIKQHLEPNILIIKNQWWLCRTNMY